MRYQRNWEEVKERYSAWWDGSPLDGCLAYITAPKEKLILPETSYIEPENLEVKWTNQELRLNNSLYGFSRTYFGGDSFPYIWVNMGPGVLAAFVGSDHHFGKDTVWFGDKKLIENWENVPAFALNPENTMWKLTSQMTEYFAAVADDRYSVSLTDIGGTLDIIASLRGTETLLIDLLDYPDEVRKTADAIDTLWLECYCQLDSIIRKYMDSTTAWMPLWCPKRWYPLQCDFSAMISPSAFDEFVIPSLEKSISALDYSIYHLDGPGQLPHVDSLLALDGLTGIQWVPGDGNEQNGSEKWFELYRKIQAKGKNLVLTGVKPEYIERLLRNISSKGLYLMAECDSESEADDLLANIKKWCRP